MFTAHGGYSETVTASRLDLLPLRITFGTFDGEGPWRVTDPAGAHVATIRAGAIHREPVTR